MTRLARWWYAVTAVLAVLAVIDFSIVQATTDTTLFGGSKWQLALNAFVYFTIWSNILVAAFAVLVARGHRPTFWFRVLEVDAFVHIVITAVVYHLLLAADSHAKGIAKVDDVLLHTVVPLLMVIGWLVFGPRLRIGLRVGATALILPVFWTICTFVRGAIWHWYPYPFLDVDTEGYASALGMVGYVVLAFMSLVFAMAGYEKLRKST